VLDPANSNRVLLPMTTGEMAETLDGGKTFQSYRPTGLTGASICSQIGETMFCANGNFGGTRRSTDRGRNFETTADFGASRGIFDIMLAGNRFVGRAYDGIYTSTDSGRSWNPRSTGLPAGSQFNRSNVAVHPTNPNYWLHAYDTSIYKTTDGGGTWTLTGLTAPVQVVSIQFGANNAIVYGTDGRGMFISTDDGQSATPINTGLVANARITSVAVSPADRNIVFASNGELILRADLRQLAAGWTALKAQYGSSHRLTFSGDGKVLHVVSYSTAVNYGQINVGVNPTADSDNDGILDGDEDAAGLDPQVKSNDVFSDNSLFVRQLYRDLLNRSVDNAGLNFWVGELAAGRQSRASMIEAFTVSGEFDSLTAPMARLYFGTFLRIPDFAGLQFWTDEFRSGRRSLVNIGEAFVTVPEFVNRYGNVDNRGLVNLIYNNVLGRPADEAGLNFWVGELSSGRLSRGAMLTQFTESAEYKTNRRPEIFTTLIYAGMLRRAPDQGGFDTSVNAIRGGAPLVSQVTNLLNSQEYRNRFLP
jgi:hypothetical protein